MTSPRNNGGGLPETGAYIATYLIDERTHLNDIYFRSGNRLKQFWTASYLPGPMFGGKKPVYVLTSRETFSCAEDFAYAQIKLLIECENESAYKCPDHSALFVM